VKRIFEIHELSATLTPVFTKHNIIFAYLFGSIVNNESTPTSDIDIAVYCKGVMDDSVFEKKLSLHLDICRTLKIDNVDIIVLNKTTNLMLIDEVIRNGILLYDTDTSLREKYEYFMIHKAIDFKTQRLYTMGI